MDYRKEIERISAQEHERLRVKYGVAVGESFAYILSDVNLAAYPKPQHGDTWGNWKYNAKTLALNYVPLNRDFDLEAPDIFKLIFHFCAKTWMSAKDAGNLIFALADLMYRDYPSAEKQEKFIAFAKRKTRRKVA